MRVAVFGATGMVGREILSVLEQRGFPADEVLECKINGVRVNARDGAAIRDVDVLKVTALNDAELVLVDAA